MMDYLSSESKSSLQLSSSPALSPILVPSPKSPAKSVHAQNMALDLNEQASNFFDDNSSEDDVKDEYIAISSHGIKGSSNEISLNKSRNCHDASSINSEGNTSRKKAPPSRPSRPQPLAIPDIFRPSESHTSFGYFVEAAARNNSFPGVIGQRQLSNSLSTPKDDASGMFLTKSYPGPDATFRHLPTHLDTSGKAIPDEDFRQRAATLPHIEYRNSSMKDHDGIIRTPYSSGIRKNFGPADMNLPTAQHDTNLNLSVRRRGNNCFARYTIIKIPAGLGLSPVEKVTDDDSRKTFETLDFDDLRLFKEIRKVYRVLNGPFRVFSARGLKGIRASHSQGRESCGNTISCAQAMYISTFPGAIPQNQSNQFSELELMKMYLHPSLGKGQYKWVHWMHHLSSATQNSSNQIPQDTEKEQILWITNLEFITGWRLWRLFLALSLVKILAIAAVLLWIFLGTSPLVWRQDAEFKDASGRIDTGILLGIMVMILGWTVLGFWVGVSWVID